MEKENFANASRDVLVDDASVSKIMNAVMINVVARDVLIP